MDVSPCAGSLQAERRVWRSPIGGDLHNGKFHLEEPRPSSEERVYLPVESVEQVYHRVTTDSAYSYMLIEYSAE